VPPPPGSSACHRRHPPCIAAGLLRAPLSPSSAASQCPAPVDATRAPATATNLDQLAPPSAPVVHPYTAYARSRPGRRHPPPPMADAPDTFANLGWLTPLRPPLAFSLPSGRRLLRLGRTREAAVCLWPPAPSATLHRHSCLLHPRPCSAAHCPQPVPDRHRGPNVFSSSPMSFGNGHGQWR
jgi:hypothetical protein